MVISGHREDGQLFVGGIMFLAPQEADDMRIATSAVRNHFSYKTAGQWRIDPISCRETCLSIVRVLSMMIDKTGNFLRNYPEFRNQKPRL